MEVTVVMTTYNRPKLLAQSLPQVEREAKDISAKLVIADDLSTDPQTIELLKGAMNRGVEVVHRANFRQVPEDPFEQNRASHHSIGMNNFFAFRHVIENYNSEYILKVDDDTYLAKGAFAKMLETHERAKSDDLEVITTSGIHTVNEPIIAETDYYYVTFAACNVAILYRTSDWANITNNYPIALLANDGFDIFFMRTYRPRFFPNSTFVSTKPSVVFHTGYTGVHVFGEDINVDFVEDTNGIYSE